MNDKAEKEERLTLELLQVIGQRSDLSQRHLAREMGVALGLANSYLKRCIRKGWIKVREAPANRYLYYLTPKGFAEKGRLTARYLSASFHFYRKAAESCGRAFAHCRAQGYSKILVCGLSDLAEIAAVRALEGNLQIVGFYDPNTEKTCFIGYPVWQDYKLAPLHDACLLTALNGTPEMYQLLIARIERERVVAPDLLELDDRGAV